MSWEGLNRRKFPRAKFPCLIKISIAGDEPQTILTHTENISLGGVCVIIKKHLDIFTAVNVEIDLMDGGETIVCQGKVVWSVRRKATESIKPSFYDIGVEFVDLDNLGREAVQKAIDHLLKRGAHIPEKSS